MAQVPIVFVNNTDVGRIIKLIGSTTKKVQKKVRIDTDDLAPAFADSNVNDISSIYLQKYQSDCQSTTKDTSLASTGFTEFVNGDAYTSVKPFYSFKTPKKANQMGKYADSAKKSSVESNTAIDKEDHKKVENNKSAVIVKKDCTVQLRTRNVINDDSDSSFSPSDFSDADLDHHINARCRIPNSVLSRKKSSSQQLKATTDVELYFDAQGSNKNLSTSDRTLQKLKKPKMNSISFSEALKKYDRSVKRRTCTREVLDQKLMLAQRHEDYFQKWIFYMRNDFNIMLFGLGSKRDLIHSFCQKCLRKNDKLIVNGFFPGLTLKSILTSIVEDIIKSQISISTIDSLLQTIEKHYNYPDNTSELFLIIHNIDGLALRAPHIQSTLSCLASMSNIRVIASIDHINASLIWTQTISSRFSWLWYDVTNYSPYSVETSYEGSLLLTGAGAGVSSRGAALALSGLLHVARSLTSNARGVFRILAEHQMEDGKEYEKLEDFTFFDLYQKCRERFLVNSELTLRAHLTEFIDHNLVQMRTGADGCEYLSLPLNVETLKEYLEQENSL